MWGEVTDIFGSQQMRPNFLMPQKRNFPIHWIVDEIAYLPLLRMRLALYVAQVILIAQQTQRMTVTVAPGFALTMIAGQTTAADPGDGGGSAQLTIYDPARRLRFSRSPLVSGVLLGSVNPTGAGTPYGSAPFIFRKPYFWTGGNSPIQVQVQNRAKANNTVTMLFCGGDPK